MKPIKRVLLGMMIIIHSAYLILIIHRAFEGTLCGTTIMTFGLTLLLTMNLFRDEIRELLRSNIGVKNTNRKRHIKK